MQLKPIRSEADYQAALQAVAPYFEHEPQAGSDAADQFEVLLLLIEHYEASHYPIAPPDPVEAIRFRMEQAGLTPKDLEPMIGRLNRVYEVLTRKRPLTLADDPAPACRPGHSGGKPDRRGQHDGNRG
jgi:HTH-type transcriptional regulator/antitoxin HigA